MKTQMTEAERKTEAIKLLTRGLECYSINQLAEITELLIEYATRKQAELDELEGRSGHLIQ